MGDSRKYPCLHHGQLLGFPKGRGVHNYGILRAWGGGNAFWNFRRQGGVKTWKPSVVEYGYFLELPNGRDNGNQ